jgi:hypothetical protein
MPLKFYRLLLIIILINCTTKTYTQELSTFFDQKPFAFSGSLNMNQIATYRNVSYSSSNPYSIMISGNAGVNIY